MASGRKEKLTEAMEERRLIRFSSRFEDFGVTGYVLGVGPKLFLLAVVNDRIQFDGFECFRIGDVSGIQPDPHAGFVEKALRLREEHLPEMPDVELASLEDLLITAGRAFPLVTIHKEKSRLDACWIGRILGVKAGLLAMWEIGPGACWDTFAARYGHKLTDITRVGFGARYEEALYLVGGEPPLPPEPAPKTGGRRGPPLQ